jgi:hypothetical protein
MNSDFFSRISPRLLALAAGLVLTAGAFAGPSAQYLHQMDLQRQDSGSTRAPHRAAMNCNACVTSPITRATGTNLSGKLAPSTVKIGSTHDCSMGGGTMTTLQGKTTGAMRTDCPVCAVPATSCCPRHS